MVTLILRLWYPAPGLPPPPQQLCGLIELVRTGEQEAFQGSAQLLDVVRRELTAATSASGVGQKP